MSKYLTLATYKTFFPVSVSTTADDALMQDAIDWAEGAFEREVGSQFDQQAVANETPLRAWVDRQGIITLIAKRAAPVSAVNAVSYLLLPNTNWQTLAWDAANGIFFPSNEAPPRPEAWKVEIIATGLPLGQYAADNIRFRWSYTGGYSSTPTQLALTIFRAAYWRYRVVREAPLGKVAVPPMGITEVIPDLPRDVALDFRKWSRVGAG